MKKFIMLKMSKLISFFFKKSYTLILCIAFFYNITCPLANAKSSTVSQSQNGSQVNYSSQNYLTDYKSELKLIENFLNNINYLTCDFIQNINGEIAGGKFYLHRNRESSGKMRIEYLDEPKVLIVVNGEILSYHDIELDEISRLSTNTTPASLLTRPNISFSAKDVEITNIKKSNNEIKVSIMKKNRKDAGEFSLVFKLDPFEFVKMSVKNDLDQVINVELKNIDFDSKIPNKLFIIKNSDNQ
jgi:outer membrane lipoprotein-sorting protein